MFLLASPGEYGTRVLHELLFVAAGLVALAYGAWQVHDETTKYGGSF